MRFSGRALTAAGAAAIVVMLAIVGGASVAGPARPAASDAPGDAATPSGGPSRAPNASVTPARDAATPTPAPTAAGTATATPESSGVDTAGGGSAIVAGSVRRTSLAVSATYDADLRIGWVDGTIAVDETIEVRNTAESSIDRLELNTVAARLGRIRRLLVRVDGRDAKASIAGQTIVVPLGGVLPVGAWTTVQVRFAATLRTSTSGSNWLFTKANGIVDLYRWLPWVSVRTPFDRPNFGDPFVTPSSPRVTVRITADRPLRYATSGVRLNADGPTSAYGASNVRDFAITAAPDFVTTTGRIDGIRIDVFARPGAPARTLLAWARRALHAQAALVGRYPYPAFTVAESAGGFGMEAPAAIWIPRGLERSRIPYLVNHETAHQWFYGVVGNDEAREPWTDEAAADFLARNVLDQRRASRCPTGRLDRSIYDYSSRCYYEVVYIQGGNLIDDVRRRVGDTRFWAGIRRYLAANRFGIAHERTLLDALDGVTPVDLGATLFNRRFPSRY